MTGFPYKLHSVKLLDIIGSHTTPQIRSKQALFKPNLGSILWKSSKVGGEYRILEPRLPRLKEVAATIQPQCSENGALSSQ